MRIGIATPTLVDGDAVGNDVMGMYATLKKLSHEVFLFAENNHVPANVFSLNQVKAMNLDLYIYHHSINCEKGINWLSELSCRKIVKYHNITPPHFFADNSNLFYQTTVALKQLETILDSPCEIWVDSEFNGKDICAIKPCEYKIIPPFNQVDALFLNTTEVKSTIQYSDWNTNILIVGRVAPNKDILEGVEGFAKYHQNNKQSRLIIVGDTGDNYTSKVKEKITQLELKSVVITGKVEINVLKAFYLLADLLLITSKHEGFCVPMVEAMALNVPVLANQYCALPYTGGDAVHYANNPNEIAIGIEYVLNNKTKYIDKGRKMFRNKYQNSSIESLFLSALNSTHAK